MKNVLLIGLGRFGRHLAEELNQLGHQVMAVDKNEERVDACMDFVTNAQIGDSTAEDFLRSLGAKNYEICYVTISDNFLSALETTSQLKELGAKCIVSRAKQELQAKFLLRNGADHVVYPEKQLAKWAAIRYTANHIFDYIELDAQHAIIEAAVPESWRDQSIGSLDIRRKYGINILAIRQNEKTNAAISAETVLKYGYRNPTGFRRWVKVAKSGGLCYTCVMGTWKSKTDTRICYSTILFSYASIERNC